MSVVNSIPTTHVKKLSVVVMTMFVVTAWCSTAYATDSQLSDAFNVYAPKIASQSGAYINALAAWRSPSDTGAVTKAANKWRRIFRNFRQKVQSSDPPYSENGSRARKLLLKSLKKYDKMTDLLVQAANYLYADNREAFSAKMEKASDVSKIAGTLMVRAQRALRA